MKLDRVELGLVDLRLVAPFTTSFGTILERKCIVVQLHSEGLIGLAECVAFDGPWYSYETVVTAWHVMADFLIDRLLSAGDFSPDAVWNLMAPVRGHNMAKAALEMACWDLAAKAESKPLSTLLGGTRRHIEVGVSLGIQSSPDALVGLAEEYLSQGYRRLKLKIEPGHDVEFVSAVRTSFPEAVIQVDANSAYSLADADVFKAMDDLDLLLIEQPLGPDDIVDHADLQSQLKTPICLDESIHSPDDARHALKLGSCRIINIKPGRVGGHLQSKAIHDVCQESGAAVWCGGMLETNIGRAHNVALASLPGFTLPGDISASNRYYAQDIASPSFELEPGGTLAVPPASGIGVELEPDTTWQRTESFSLATR